VVRVLAVSDVVEDTLWADTHLAHGAELIVGCGDLPFEYLGRLMNALDAPLVFVPGNHDPDLSGYRTSRAGLTLRAGMPVRQPWPDGAICADGAIVTAAGLTVAGLGGCRRYGEGPNQYTDRQFARRARRLAARAALRRQRVDVLLTHAPPRGVGDADDPPHRGFTALHRLAGRLRPALLLHGHVDPDALGGREHRMGATVVRNVTGWQLLTVDPVTGVAAGWLAGHGGAGRRRAR
jgi:calcineurin-like phosphoesterase family protein